MRDPSPAPWTSALLLGLALVLAASVPRAQAQLDVEIALARETYLLYERVQVAVDITNLSTEDIVLGGPGGTDWLTFTLTGNGGTPLSPYQAEGFDIEPTVIAGRQKLRKTVVLNSRYSLAQRGNYTVRASVYYPPTGRYITTQNRRFNIDDGIVFWERPVPVSPERGGGFRRLELLSYSATERTDIYLRIRDQASRNILKTFALGRVILHRQPQATLDRDNLLHVVFMGAPNTYSHTVVDAFGEVLRQDVYQDKGGNPPRLMMASDGTVGVRGGVFQDPEAIAAANDPDNPNRIRDLSERPPGWGAPPLPDGPDGFGASTDF
jgi:hypothetical protein